MFTHYGRMAVRCGCVTYSHGVSRVSEVREGAERRQGRLRDGHQALGWDKDHSSRQQTLSFEDHRSFFWLDLFFFLFYITLLQEVARLQVLGGRAADGPQAEQVGAASSSSWHCCYLSLLALVYLCQLRARPQISLLHVAFDR